MKTEVFYIPLNRRRLLHSLALGAGGLWAPAVFAEALTLTPRATEGPYYPDHLPLDQDNDLVQVTGKDQPAQGTLASFGGRVLGVDGRPISGTTIELWQADANGCYIHSNGAPKGKERDPHFQGYGKMETNAKGEYRFRTIIPGLYTGRTRHWHVTILQGKKRLLTTQLFIAGEPQNERDGILNRMGDDAQRLSVIREFKPMTEGSDERFATWDVIVGKTPEDSERRGGPPPKRPPPPRGERSS